MRARKRPRFKFLDTVAVRYPSSKRTEKYRALVIQSNMSAFGDTYQLQWFDGTETVMHGDALKKVLP